MHVSYVLQIELGTMDKSALALIYSRKKLPCDQPPSVTQPTSTKSGEEFIQVEHTIPKERLGEWNENFYQISKFQPGGRKGASRVGPWLPNFWNKLTTKVSVSSS